MKTVTVSEVVVTPVYSVFPTIALVPELEINQLYVYGDVPPDIVAVQDTDWYDSTLVADGQFDNIGVEGGTYADITVRVPDSTLLVVSGIVAESVIITFAASVFPARFDGMTHANELVVPVIPVNNMFATRLPVIVLTIR